MGGIATILLGSYMPVHPIVLIVQLLVLDMLLKESSIFNTSYFRIFYVLTSIWLLGTVCIFMHWPMGSELVVISNCIGVVVYTFRTMRKPAIQFLDAAKWIWVVSIALSTVFFNSQLSQPELMSYLPIAGFFLLMLAFFLSAGSFASDAEVQQEDKPIDQL